MSTLPYHGSTMHALDRRRFLGFSAAFAAGPLLLGQDKTKSGDGEDTSFVPDTLFLTWQRDPTTTITVQWAGEKVSDTAIRYRSRGSGEWLFGPEPVANPFPVVELGKTQKANEDLFQVEGRELAPFPRGPLKPTGPTNYFVYRAEIANLTPGTEYEFVIGVRSPVFRFRTMPAKLTNEFSFISGGDCGTNSHAVANNRVAAAQDPMFAIVAGDLGYDNGVTGETALQFLRNYSKTMIDSQGRLIPMISCLGNHEVRGSYGKSPKEATFFMPFFDGLFKDHTYATLDFGDYLSLVLLDTGHAAPIAGEQTAWLNESLAARAGKPHLFAINHVPAYPSYRTPETGSEKAGTLKPGTGADQRKHWAPLFEKHQVDLVLEHHDHTFKRTKPLKGGKVDEATGIVYLGDGSWGRLRVPKEPEKRTYLDTVSTNYHITLHRIQGQERYHLALGETGKVLDIYRSIKRPRQAQPGY